MISTGISTIIILTAIVAAMAFTTVAYVRRYRQNRTTARSYTMPNLTPMAYGQPLRMSATGTGGESTWTLPAANPNV